MNDSTFIVYDLETTGADPNFDLPVEIYAKCYNERTLEPIEGASFKSMCCPPKDVPIQQGALDVTGIKREDIEASPKIEVVWPNFVSWVSKFNKGKSGWDAPIPVGHNIVNFDNVIAKRCCGRFCPKKEKTVLFHTNRSVDFMHILFHWFENSNELPNYKLDTVRKYFGLSGDGAHRAEKDVDDVAELVFRFLKYHRALMSHNPKRFKGAFKSNGQETKI